MPKFRKKPIVIEAVQFIGTNYADIGNLEGIKMRILTDDPKDGDLCLLIDTLEGTHRANPSDWIIKGVKGEFYPIKDDIFRETYEPVD